LHPELHPGQASAQPLSYTSIPNSSFDKIFKALKNKITLMKLNWKSIIGGNELEKLPICGN
jgi:hypothetical protein